MNKVNKSEFIIVRGTINSGIGQSNLFMKIPWVNKQFREKLGIDPYPGTLNITVLPEDRSNLNTIKNTRGIEITPEDANFCAANSFTALINGKIKGAVIIPMVPNYPDAQLEIISSEHIKQSLSLKDRDLVEIKVYL